MKITLLAHHIEWDTDGDIDAARALPSKMEVEVDLDAVECLFPVSINDQICNQLSDATGWCVLDYKLQGYSAEADFALQMVNVKEQQDLEAMIDRDEKAAAALGISVDRYYQLCEDWNHLHDDGWDVIEKEDWLKEAVSATAQNK